MWKTKTTFLTDQRRFLFPDLQLFATALESKIDIIIIIAWIFWEMMN